MDFFIHPVVSFCEKRFYWFYTFGNSLFLEGVYEINGIAGCTYILSLWRLSMFVSRWPDPFQIPMLSSSVLFLSHTMFQLFLLAWFRMVSKDLDQGSLRMLSWCIFERPCYVYSIPDGFFLRKIRLSVCELFYFSINGPVVSSRSFIMILLGSIWDRLYSVGTFYWLFRLATWMSEEEVWPSSRVLSSVFRNQKQMMFLMPQKSYCRREFHGIHLVSVLDI